MSCCDWPLGSGKGASVLEGAVQQSDEAAKTPSRRLRRRVLALRRAPGVLQLIRVFCGHEAVTADGRWELAGFGDRFLGDFVDGGISLLVALPAFLLVDRRVLGPEADFLAQQGPAGAADVVCVAWFLWNLTYLVGTTGQSWGRRVCGIKVVRMDGRPPGFWRALGRNVFALFVSAPILYLGFAWVIWDRQKQAWHDKLFGTFVLRHVSD